MCSAGPHENQERRSLTTSEYEEPQDCGTMGSVAGMTAAAGRF